MPQSAPSRSATEKLLDEVHRASFAYFLKETNPENGLVLDGKVAGSPASIAAVGFGLSSLPVAVERGWMDRSTALEVALATARFFRDSPQDGARDGVGYKGFFYHFLDMGTGRRAWKSELSTIDTTFLIAGLLCVAEYFEGGNQDESELRSAAGTVYERVEWDWAQNGGDTVTMGWTPEKGFLRYRWEGYNEALLLYALAAGSPTHAVSSAAFDAYTRTYRWKHIYGHAHVYAGPLFIHQFSHLWVDFRGIPDEYMRAKRIDYHENSRRATLVQRQYAIRNPRGFAGYGADLWGITASDGPGPAIRSVGGRKRTFHGYRARGVPFGPDDGTLAPWAAIASLPFAPEAVLPCLASLAEIHEGQGDPYGFENAFNPTFPDGDPDLGWVSPNHFALNQGPIVLAIENYRTGLVWRLMRRCQPLVAGLRRNGFSGGWLTDG